MHVITVITCFKLTKVSQLPNITRGLNCCRAVPLLQSCVRAARVEGCACLVAVSTARGVVPPPPVRAWSVLTDSQRPIAGRERQKGAFRATYARFAGGPRDTKSRVAVSTTAGEHPRP